MKPTKLDDKGLEFIEHWEGKRNLAYKDSGGIWTIGMGHTGPEVKEGLFWTNAQINFYAFKDVEKAEAEVNKLTASLTDLTQNQFNALVDFEFNTGALAKSTLLKKLLAGDIVNADLEFERWAHVKGLVIEGLLNRREAEAKLFVTPDQEQLS